MDRATLDRLKSRGFKFSERHEELADMQKLTLEREEARKKKEISTRYDYLPIVKINSSEEPINAIISIKECKNCKKEKINLGQDYEEDKQEYIVAEIVITQNSITKIPLTIRKGSDKAGFDDEDGVLNFTCNNGAVKFKFVDSDDTDFENNAASYDIKDTEYSDDFVLEIEPTKLARGTKFYINVFASDDNDSIISDKKNSTRKGICGKFNFTVIQSDVFLESEKENLIKINEALVQNDSVCFRVADKELAELINDKTLILKSYMGENSYTRMTDYKSKGYIASEKIFDQYIFKGGGNFEPIQYDNKSIDIFKSYFNKLIFEKLGFHIFCFSLVGGYHVLTLIIDNTDFCNQKFLILDQIRIRKWDQLKNIDEEMLRLTNVLWLSNYNHEEINGTKLYKKFKTECAIWKIKR
jgi:hypothetical protein